MKNSSVSYIINARDNQPNSITMVIRGRPYTMDRSHISFLALIDLLKNEKPDADKILALFDKKKAMSLYSGGGVVITDGCDGQKVFCFRGQELSGVLVNRIKEFMRNGIPWTPMFRFLNNIVHNPSENSRKSLFSFLENENLPLTPDGCFLGYKGVQSDYWSIRKGHHTMLSGIQNDAGEIFNAKGQKVKVPREEVVEDPSQSCARGLHVGSHSYACNWAGPDGVLVLVKVDPRDVVSVPSSNREVMRVCSYEVVEILPVRMALKHTFEPQFEKMEVKESKDRGPYNVRDRFGRFAKWN